MSKKFKGGPCVYCATKVAESRDHVFAREFFLKSDRQDLPQVPACKTCNRAKSDLEHYLTAVLPFGARHESATENLESMVPGRLANNLRLTRHLRDGKGQMWTREKSGLFVQTMTLPFDSEKLEQLVRYIVRGLVWHHWKFVLGADCLVEVQFLNRKQLGIFDQLLARDVRNPVVGSLGNGVFRYRGAQTVDNPKASMWQLSLYGGLALSDDNEQFSVIGATTGTKEMFEKIERNADLRQSLGLIQP